MTSLIVSLYGFQLQRIEDSNSKQKLFRNYIFFSCIESWKLGFFFHHIQSIGWKYINILAYNTQKHTTSWFDWWRVTFRMHRGQRRVLAFQIKIRGWLITEELIGLQTVFWNSRVSTEPMFDPCMPKMRSVDPVTLQLWASL